MRTLFCSFLLLVSASLGLSEDKAREAEIDNIREAVFRWQFSHNASGQKTNAQAYFLGVGEKDTDPSDEFMKRFTRNKPPVRKVSECRTGTRGVFDRKTGEKGLIFRITRIDWKSGTQVDVAGGYYEAGLSASGNTYTVEKKNGKWQVTKDKMHWISERYRRPQWTRDYASISIWLSAAARPRPASFRPLHAQL